MIGLGQIAWSIDQDTQRSKIWSHMGAYQSCEATTVCAVSSRDESACLQVQEKYLVPSYYTDYREMLAGEELDIVSICTPIQTHYDIVMACIKAGVKAVFCEKTLSFSFSEARQMVQACEERGVVLAVNHVKRWDSLYQYVYELLEKGRIGKLESIVCYGTTALHTSTSHLIDLMCWYAGKPLWIVGELCSGFVRTVHGCEDPGGVGMVKFDTGAVGFIKGSGASPMKYLAELDLIGSEGRLTIADDGQRLSLFEYAETSNSPGQGYEILQQVEVECPVQNERMLAAVTDIIDCIQTGKEPASSGRSSLLTLEIIEGIKDSSGRL